MRLFLFTTLFVIFLSANAQELRTSSACPNSDFENGNFDGWTTGIGNCCPINTLSSPIVTGRHTIMTGTNTDPNTCNTVTEVAPGGTYSARLGNSDTGAEAESLRYSITVSSSSTLFIYKYAVVLEDPGHADLDQPRFQVKILNSAQQLLDPTCGFYTVAAAENIPGFQTCNYMGSTIRYKDWTTVGLDLTSYVGQTITLEFATGDCSLGAHFGYAYVDAYCSPLQISSNFCSSSFPATLTAPVGFTYLWSTGETSQSIQVAVPQAGQSYSCVLTSVTGCTVNISTIMQQVTPTTDFTVTNACYNNAIFTSSSIIPDNITLTSFIWDFGDGSTATTENAVHTYAGSGTYTVSYSTSNASGCYSTVSHPVTVVIPPTATINYGVEFCTNVTNPQPVVLNGTGAYQGGVFSSSSGLFINANTGAITPSLSVPGTYTIAYQIPTINNCTVPVVTATVKINLTPTAIISYPNTRLCVTDASQNAILTGTGQYQGGSFTSNSGLNIDSFSGKINPSLSTPGSYLISYSSAALAGCNVPPATTIVQINPLPEVNLEDTTICFDSETNTYSNAVLSAGLNDFDYTFVWEHDGATIPNATQSQYTVSQIGNYSVVATNIHTGCVSTSATAIVTLFKIPTKLIISLVNSFTGGASIIATVTGGTGPYLYQIDNETSQDSNIFSNPTPGLHHIYITDRFGCTHLVTEAMIMDYPAFFTPNGDGYNDIWHVRHLELQPEAVVKIFDRYGKLITELLPNSDGWDGTLNGHLLPSSDYWFSINYQVFDALGTKKWEQFKSHFSMKR